MKRLMTLVSVALLVACANNPTAPSGPVLGASPTSTALVTGCAVAQAPEDLDSNANNGKFDLSWSARPTVDDYVLRITRLDGTTPPPVSVVHVYPNEVTGDRLTKSVNFAWHPKVNGTYSFEVAVSTPCGAGPFSRPVVEGISDVPQDQNSNVRKRW